MLIFNNPWMSMDYTDIINPQISIETSCIIPGYLCIIPGYLRVIHARSVIIFRLSMYNPSMALAWVIIDIHGLFMDDPKGKRKGDKTFDTFW